jgi:hypothetical protein
MGDVITFDAETMAKKLVNKEIELDDASWAAIARAMKRIRSDEKPESIRRGKNLKAVSLDRVKRRLLNTLRMQSELLFKEAARDRLFDRSQSDALVNYLKLMEKFEADSFDPEKMSDQELLKLAGKKR